MSDIPDDLRYASSHEWISLEEEGLARVGVSDHAQSELGDVVFVELPEVGDNFSAGDACAVVESVKAASDIYCPLDGEVVEVNGDLEDTPESINSDPYGDGWLFLLKLDDESDADNLMDADAYQAELEDG